ncbi:hypothetical protein M407DRAFT_218619 [Tulasnella calospora MUT 4182]|uniref:Uncharacterized protein n=1 Tax=Tulasnella calospora MUT 4182 TaxID=1051891 RepID=A0A0C3QYP4_9AGAM|nr:hypothetical protein M407DRAFT_218619 [Tulasnella calospora MUT 4182]
MTESSTKGTPNLPELPTEVHRQIVENVGMPSYPSQYLIPQTQRQDLGSLCLASNFFHSIATEVLHARVHITPRNISSFVQRVKDSVAGPPKVKFLAFVGFAFVLPEWEQEFIITILQGLPSETVTHILFDMPLRSIYRVPSPNDNPESSVLRMTHALNQFVNVKEFISVRDEAHLLGWMTGPVLWPHWPQIQRVALYNPEILEEAFIEAIVQSKSLRLMCCLNPRLAGGIETDEDFAELIDQAAPELSFLFLDAENMGDEETDGDYFPIAKEELYSEPLLHYAIEEPDRVTLVDVEEITDELDKRSPTSRPTDWFFNLAVSGRLWEIGRFAISTATAKRYLQLEGEVVEEVEDANELT